MTDLTARFVGCMVGSALGDAIGELAFRTPSEAALRQRVAAAGELTYTDDTAMALGLAQALYAFLRNPDSFEGCLLCATLNSGGRDTLGAMACAISGAYLGAEAIPSEWRARLENHGLVEGFARQLAAQLPTDRKPHSS